MEFTREFTFYNGIFLTVSGESRGKNVNKIKHYKDVNPLQNADRLVVSVENLSLEKLQRHIC